MRGARLECDIWNQSGKRVWEKHDKNKELLAPPPCWMNTIGQLSPAPVQAEHLQPTAQRAGPGGIPVHPARFRTSWHRSCSSVSCSFSPPLSPGRRWLPSLSTGLGRLPPLSPGRHRLPPLSPGRRGQGREDCGRPGVRASRLMRLGLWRGQSGAGRSRLGMLITSTMKMEKIKPKVSLRAPVPSSPLNRGPPLSHGAHPSRTWPFWRNFAISKLGWW